MSRSFVCRVMVIAFAVAGCAGKKDDVQHGRSAGSLWTVRIGSVGGFTGGGSGHLVSADGTVEAWSRITPADSIERRALGRASAAAVRELHAAMMAPALGSIVYEQSGNMTRFLEWNGAPGPRRWSWPEGPAETKVPAALRRAYDAAAGAVTSAGAP